MAKSGSPKNKKVANSLLAVSSAAVLAVYSAGYARTRSAADQFDQRAAERRPAAPGPGRAGSPTAPFQGTGLNAPAAGSGRAMLPANGEAREAIDIKPSLLASVNPLPSGAGITAGPAAPASPPTASPTAPSAAPATTYSSATPAPVTASIAAPAAPAPEHKPDHKYVDVAPPADPGTAIWKDGTYYGWGTSRHGDIQAEVYIEGGRIVVASISDCRTRYSCNIIEKLPPEVAQRQSPEVDYVTGATESAEAFYYAVKEALSKAK